MHLIKKINAVGEILRQADKHVLTFQQHAQISCTTSCSLCCVKPDIETTILEFLPGAYNLFLSGDCDNVLDNILSKPDALCVFHNPFNMGNCCTHYQCRGLICRLFGFSAITTKTGDKSLVTCKPIKQLLEGKDLQAKIRFAPEMSDYYLSLFGIDPKLTIQYFPINQSIKKALEIILLHFRYNKKPA